MKHDATGNVLADLPPLEVRQPRSKIKLPVLHEQLLADGARCWECPLGRLSKQAGIYLPGRPVSASWDYRKGKPKLALVGELPGKREVQMQRVFIGPSGKLLDLACRQAGVPRDQLAILNAGACGPVPTGADEVKKAVLAACRPRLLTELRRLQPNTVFAIGAMSLKTLAPELPSGVTVLRGALLEIGKDVVTGTDTRPTLFASFHPAHILRGGDADAPDQPGDEGGRAVDLLYYYFLYDLAKAWRFANGLAKPWRDDCDLFVVANGSLHRATIADDTGLSCLGDPAEHEEFVEAIARVYDEARACGAFSFDVETDAKDSLEAKLTAISFATVDGGLAATWAAYLCVPQALEIARKMLADSTVRKQAQNRVYDCIVLPRHGLPVAHPIDDTMLMHHAAFPGLPHKLDQIAQQFLVVPSWKDEFRKSSKNEPELVLYNARDSIGTTLIVKPIKAVMRAHKTERVYEADRQVVGVAQRMREFGFWIDRKEQARQSKIQHARLDYMRASLTKDFAQIEPAWRERLAKNLAIKQRKKDPHNYLERVSLRFRQLAERKKSPSDVGLMKTKAKADLVALFEVLRIPFSAYTPKGSPVTDKKAMESAAAKHPLMRQLIHMREAQHVLATYIDGLPVKVDGRVHPDWSVTKISGRWSAGKSQNIPKQVAGWPPEEEPDDKVAQVGDRASATHQSGSDQRNVSAAGSATARSGSEVAQARGDGDSGRFAAACAGPRPGFRWKRKPSGDYVTPVENARAIITAPTVAEILSHALDQPQVFQDARYKAIFDRAFNLGKGRLMVGADQCFATGTEIETVFGPTPIEKLKVGDLVYSYRDRRPVIGKVVQHVRVSGCEPVLRVTLDNGKSFRVTKEHKMLVCPTKQDDDPIDVLAGALKVGDRLLPLRQVACDGYVNLYAHKAIEWSRRTHLIAEAFHGPRPAGAHVHHINEVRDDDRPENLVYETSFAHHSHHGRDIATRGWADPKVRKKMSKGIRRSIKERGGYHGSNNPRWGDRRQRCSSVCLFCNKPFEFYAGCSQGKYCTRSCYAAARRVGLNHKVVSIVPDGTAEIWSIGVDPDKNYALSAGVFVRNSQLELRIAALLGKDKFLIDAYLTGADVHALNAAVCFPKVFPKLVTDFKEIVSALDLALIYSDAVPPEKRKPVTPKTDLAKLNLDDITRTRLLKLQKPWSKLRDLAKRLVYAWIYRGRAETAYGSLVKEFPELELSAVAEAFKLLDQKLVGWVAWCNRNETTVRQHREVREALLNRVRLFPLGNYNINIAVNFPVQAFGASLVAFSIFRYCALVEPELLEIDQLYAWDLLDRSWVEERRAEGYGVWSAPAPLLIHGHDSLTCECDEDDAEKMSKFLELCMSFDITIDGASMKFFGEAAIGRRLSET